MNAKPREVLMLQGAWMTKVFYLRFHIPWSRSQKSECHPKWNWLVWTSIKLMPPHPDIAYLSSDYLEFQMLVAPWPSSTGLVFIWYFCVGKTTGIGSQNTDMKSYSVYSASSPRPIPWYWNLLSFKANNKSRITASEMKFMRHKKCILEDYRRNQDNLDVLRLHKHDQSSELHKHMNSRHS